MENTNIGNTDQRSPCGRRCVAWGCSNTNKDNVSLHLFPLNRPTILRLWTSFVKVRRKDWTGPSRHSVLCSAHFSAECYPMKYRIMESMGQTVKRKDLEKDAVPTIHVPVSPSCLPTMATTPDRSTPNGHKRNTVDDLESTPRRTVKKPRTAFMKRENFRVIKEFDKIMEEEQFQGHIHQQENLTDTVEKENCPPDPVVSDEQPATRSVGCQLSYRKPPRKSHYTQTKFIGRDKVCQTVVPKTRDIGINCNIIPSPDLAPRPTVPLPEPSPTDSDLDSNYLGPDGESDDSFHASSFSEMSDSDDDQESRNEERSFIVYEKKLLELFHNCPKCAAATYGFVKSCKGSMVIIEQECGICGYNRTWTSQPMVGSIPAGNLAISCALLFSGSLPTKLLRFLEFMKIPSISYSTFMNHQHFYLQPSIVEVWEDHQRSYVSETCETGLPVCIGGDGRADTPGHSAKYGSYSVMDLDQGIVIDVQLVQSNEVKSSYHMEKEGLIRSINFLQGEGLRIGTIVTDRHVQIKKWIRENLCETKHSFDVWHVAKGLKKKLTSLSKEKECEALTQWIRSITNHLYWVAASTPDGDGDMMWEKWQSVGNHIQNVHNGHGSLFPACTHGDLDTSTRKKKWLKPATKVCEKLQAIISSSQMKKDIPMLSTCQQTSELEAYHSVINHFAPKMIGFSYHGMQSRLVLAALHFNENVMREQASLPNGEKQYRITFPKQKNGEYTVRQVKTKCTFDYVKVLTETVTEKVKRSTMMPRNWTLGEAPPPLCHQYVHPGKMQAVSSFRSRFGQEC